MKRRGSEDAERPVERRRKAVRPLVILVMALLSGGLAAVLVDTGVRDAVKQQRIESAEHCAGAADTDCLQLVPGLLTSQVSGGGGYRTWEIVADRGDVLRVRVSIGDSKDIARVAPERVTAGVWKGDVVWLDTSVGRVRDTLYTYASALGVTLFGLLSGSLGLMLARAAIALRRRTGSWWAVVRPGEEVDVTNDRTGRALVTSLVLLFTAGWSVGLSDSLWGLVVPVVGWGLYRWHVAASATPDPA